MRTLIENGTILMMDEAFGIVKRGHLVIEDDHIAYVGEAALHQEIDHVIDASGCFVLPGMINTTVDGAALIQRSTPSQAHARLHDSLMYLMYQYLGTELLHHGVTTFADQGSYRDKAALACGEIGIRAVLGETIRNDQETGRTLSLSQQFIKDWSASDLIIPVVAVDSISRCDPSLMEDAMNLAVASDTMIMVKAEASEQEWKQIQSEYHTSIIQRLDDLHMLNEHTCLIGGIPHSSEELSLLKRRSASVSLQLSSTLYKGEAIPPVYEFLKYQIPVGLGSGSPKYSAACSLLEELRLLMLSQRTLYHNPAFIEPKQALYMATLGGAKALRLDHAIGSLEVGKKADLVLLDTAQSWMYPNHDPYEAVVMHAQSQNIRDVFVDGKQVFRHTTAPAAIKPMKEELMMELDDHE